METATLPSPINLGPRQNRAIKVPIPTTPIASCEPCGHQWQPRSSYLSKCPRCQSKTGLSVRLVDSRTMTT